MNLTATLIVFAASAVCFFWAMRVAARPADPLKPRLINYNLVMVAAAFIGLVMLVHMINLAGFKTGRY
jgi:hypothetical protein